MKWIRQFGEATVWPGRRTIDLAGKLHPQSLMRPTLVENLQELIELGLLLENILAGRFGRFFLERQMHAFMAAVLLWMARPDPLDLDPQPQPPDRQLTEIEEGIRRGEGNAVIRANGLGQSEVGEDAFEGTEGIELPGGFHSLARQQIAGGIVGNGERIAVAPVAQEKLSLVVRAPQVIGMLC